MCSSDLLILEHEGQAALLEMGEAIPDASELPGVTIPDPPAPEPEAQGVIPGMEGPPAPENKVIDLSSVRAGAGQEQGDPAVIQRIKTAKGSEIK